MARTIEQRLAEAEAVLARRKQLHRQLLTRQKIIIGGAILSAAGRDASLAAQVANILRERVFSKDLAAIQPVLDQLAVPQAAPPAPEPIEAEQGQVMPERSPLAGLENVARRAAVRRH